jgi:hypothetical protein
MKASNFSDAQKAFIIKQGDEGTPVAEICRKAGISPVKATGPREQANGRDAPKALKPGRMRELVRGMCSEWAVSIRTACGAIGFDRSTFHYQSRRTDQAAVAKRLREICEI